MHQVMQFLCLSIKRYRTAKWKVITNVNAEVEINLAYLPRMNH